SRGVSSPPFADRAPPQCAALRQKPRQPAARLALESATSALEFDPPAAAHRPPKQKVLPPHASMNVKFYTLRSAAWREPQRRYLFLPDGARPPAPTEARTQSPAGVGRPARAEVHRGRPVRPHRDAAVRPAWTPRRVPAWRSRARQRARNSNLEGRAAGHRLGQRNFYSDINCLQLAKRTYWEKLPLQATSPKTDQQKATFAQFPSSLQSNGVRLSVVAAQPMGGAQPGQRSLDVCLLDRTLAQAMDSRLAWRRASSTIGQLPAPSACLLLEGRPRLRRPPDDAEARLPPAAGHASAWTRLLHPPVPMPPQGIAAWTRPGCVYAPLSLCAMPPQPARGLLLHLCLNRASTSHTLRRCRWRPRRPACDLRPAEAPPGHLHLAPPARSVTACPPRLRAPAPLRRPWSPAAKVAQPECRVSHASARASPLVPAAVRPLSPTCRCLSARRKSLSPDVRLRARRRGVAVPPHGDLRRPSKIAQLNEKLTLLERKVDFIEARIKRDELVAAGKQAAPGDPAN
uniref:Enkurin domain-containing protein n=1 Tax=Macrostomum lignano TaxID=282301 RepID=A0A1I8JPB6_9PLAT